MDDEREPWMLDPRLQAAVDALLDDPWPEDPTPGYFETREVGSWEVQPPSPPRLLVDIREAARILGCGRSLVYEFIGSGQLPVVKLGHLTRIPLTVLEEFVAGKLVVRKRDGRTWWEKLKP